MNKQNQMFISKIFSLSSLLPCEEAIDVRPKDCMLLTWLQRFSIAFKYAKFRAS